MTTMQIISLVSLFGWLVLVASALASYRLGLSQIVRMGLIWLAIFVGGFVVVSWLI